MKFWRGSQLKVGAVPELAADAEASASAGGKAELEEAEVSTSAGGKAELEEADILRRCKE